MWTGWMIEPGYAAPAGKALAPEEFVEAARIGVDEGISRFADRRLIAL